MDDRKLSCSRRGHEFSSGLSSTTSRSCIRVSFNQVIVAAVKTLE
jgi:hypothetical protein